MKTGIEWTDETWNPVTGCTNISPGCDNCYAEKITNRFKRHPWGQVTLHEDRLRQPEKWKTPRKVFLCSMGDLFHSDVPFDFIEQVFITMLNAHRHTFQVLTKRPGRMAWWINNYWIPTFAQVSKRLPPNIWVGTSVESQKYAPRLDLLAKIPAQVRFVSYEPALGPVDFRKWLVLAHPDWWKESDERIVSDGPRAAVDWVIAGGESGPGARPAHPDWFRSVHDQCQVVGVPFFFKQWGAHAPQEQWGLGELIAVPSQVDTADYLMRKATKHAAGAVLDGREWREFPEPQRVPV